MTCCRWPVADISFFEYMTAIMKSDLTASERWAAVAIAKHTNDIGHDCFATVPTLAAETGLSERQIHRIRIVLVEKKWVEQKHFGRGGRSTLSNCYDLHIPSDESIGHHGLLQKDTESVQKDTESVSIGHHGLTSVPTSTPSSAHASVPQQPPLKPQDQGTELAGDDYWVGRSKKHPDGYFIRQEGHTKPPGSVDVHLTDQEVKLLFSSISQYSYESIRQFMLDKAKQANTVQGIQ